MAYTVLARKYRSRTFSEVIGQEPIATTLCNAIQAGRIHHGYLFTGTRGVGKTSMARILAKALNCLESDGPTATPCCKCEACTAIAEGQDIDVIEIDAASNTGVDNIRDLRSNAAYRPARCRFKIYIIDEVHMLSTGAFNALLKTLEEPPEHVKFILATTEIQKVPATIQSRCQRFNFRNIGTDEIAGRLESITAEEGAKVEPAVARRVARLAAGSMRDALSILDQLLSISPDGLSTDVLDEVIPPPQDEQVTQLLTFAADGDVAAVLEHADRILAGGRGLDVFCNDAIEVTRQLMLLRACGADSHAVDIAAGERDRYIALAARFELSHYVQIIAMLEELRRNVRFSAAGRALVDAVLVRIAMLASWSSIESILAGTAGDQKKKSPPQPVTRPAASVVVSPPEPAAAPLVPVARARPSIAHPASSTSDSRPAKDPAPAPPAAPKKDAKPASDNQAVDRDAILKDPVVGKAMELFDGVVIDADREPARRPPPRKAGENEAT